AGDGGDGGRAGGLLRGSQLQQEAVRRLGRGGGAPGEADHVASRVGPQVDDLGIRGRLLAALGRRPDVADLVPGDARRNRDQPSQSSSPVMFLLPMLLTESRVRTV